MQEETNALIERVLEGDLDAFEGIIERHQRELWSVVAYYLKDRTQITEVVDATFVKAYFALESFEVGRDFEAWIKTIARNEVRMHLRRRLTEKAATASYVDRLAAEAAMDEVERDRVETMKDYLASCLESLPDEHQALIEARYHRDWPVPRIATELKRSAEAVKKSLCRIRTQLRICIEKKAVQSAH